MKKIVLIQLNLKNLENIHLLLKWLLLNPIMIDLLNLYKARVLEKLVIIGERAFIIGRVLSNNLFNV